MASMEDLEDRTFLDSSLARGAGVGGSNVIGDSKSDSISRDGIESDDRDR